jgi:hypothetical protein
MNDNILCSNNLTVIYDTSITQEILDRYRCKLFYRGYQDTRKKAGLVQTDHIQMEYICSDELYVVLQQYLTSFDNYIRVSEFSTQETLLTTDIDVSSEHVKISLFKK